MRPESAASVACASCGVTATTPATAATATAGRELHDRSMPASCAPGLTADGDVILQTPAVAEPDVWRALHTPVRCPALHHGGAAAPAPHLPHSSGRFKNAPFRQPGGTVLHGSSPRSGAELAECPETAVAAATAAQRELFSPKSNTSRPETPSAWDGGGDEGWVGAADTPYDPDDGLGSAAAHSGAGTPACRSSGQLSAGASCRTVLASPASTAPDPPRVLCGSQHLLADQAGAAVTAPAAPPSREAGSLHHAMVGVRPAASSLPGRGPEEAPVAGSDAGTGVAARADPTPPAHHHRWWEPTLLSSEWRGFLTRGRHTRAILTSQANGVSEHASAPASVALTWHITDDSCCRVAGSPLLAAPGLPTVIMKPRPSAGLLSPEWEARLRRLATNSSRALARTDPHASSPVREMEAL